MGAWLVFAGVGLVVFGAALMVVRTSDLVHGVLWLALALLGTAGLYAALDAGFMAAIQVLLYTGGVITLMLFAVLLARHKEGIIPAGGSVGQGSAGLISAAIFGLITASVVHAKLPTGPGGGPDTRALGVVLLKDLVLPFEALSVLLLGAMIGAIVLSRRTDA